MDACSCVCSVMVATCGYDGLHLCVGLHRSVRREDILKLKFQHAKQFVRLCKEMSEKVRVYTSAWQRLNYRSVGGGKQDTRTTSYDIAWGDDTSPNLCQSHTYTLRVLT